VIPYASPLPIVPVTFVINLPQERVASQFGQLVVGEVISSLTGTDGGVMPAIRRVSDPIA